VTSTSADDAARVRAFRIARQGLAEPGPGDASALLAGWALQDSPPGAAATAFAARDTAWPQDETIALYNARTATAVVRREDSAAFATALHPGEDEAALEPILGSAAAGFDGSLAEAAALGVEAVADALDGRSLSRDDLHEELRGRLPEGLLPWCPGCKSHHARRGLLVMASLSGRLCIDGRVGRQPRFARTDQELEWAPPPAERARAQLVRRYLAAYGPSTADELAQWAGLARVHASALWATVADELAEADGGAVLATDVDALADPPQARGVRLLGPGDPLLLGRDRARLVGDAGVRRRLWSAIPTTGLVLSDGEPVATWKARKRGKRLAITVDPFAGSPDRALLQEAADRVAGARGAVAATLG
jgi:hypothetical protein